MTTTAASAVSPKPATALKTYFVPGVNLSLSTLSTCSLTPVNATDASAPSPVRSPEMHCHVTVQLSSQSSIYAKRLRRSEADQIPDGVPTTRSAGAVAFDVAFVALPVALLSAVTIEGTTVTRMETSTLRPPATGSLATRTPNSYVLSGASAFAGKTTRFSLRK